MTVGVKVIEAVGGVFVGVAATSIALIGFGLGSVVEISASIIAIWRLKHEADEGRRVRAESAALRWIGIAFLALAAYVGFASVRSLLRDERPDQTMVGIVIAAVASVVMPVLAGRKRRIAVALGSGALKAESRQTDFCAYLSWILLGGLLLNAWLGWWWADPVAAMAMCLVMTYEGIQTIRGFG